MADKATVYWICRMFSIVLDTEEVPSQLSVISSIHSLSIVHQKIQHDSSLSTIIKKIISNWPAMFGFGSSYELHLTESGL